MRTAPVRLALKALALWLAILLLAIANGALREAVLLPALGSTAGLVASGTLLCLLIFLVALVSVRWLGAASSRQAWFVGWFWLVLTIAFEFGFGALVQHKPWPEMLAAYSFEGGNIWPLVLGVTLVAPASARALRRPLRH